MSDQTSREQQAEILERMASLRDCEARLDPALDGGQFWHSDTAAIRAGAAALRAPVRPQEKEDQGGTSLTEGASVSVLVPAPELPHAECDQCGLKQSEWELPLVVSTSCPRHYLDDDSCDGVIRLIAKCRYCGEDIRQDDAGEWMDRETFHNCDAEPPAPRHKPPIPDMAGTEPRPICKCGQPTTTSQLLQYGVCSDCAPDFDDDEGCATCGGTGELPHDCGEDTCCCLDKDGPMCPTCGGMG